MKTPVLRSPSAALAAALACLAATPSKADSVFWNPSATSGLFTEGSSWIGGVAPVTENRGVFSNLTEAVTVSFPAGTTEIAVAPHFGARYDANTPSRTYGYDVTFDATDRKVAFGLGDTTRLAGTYSGTATDRFYPRIHFDSPVSGRTDYMTLEDATLRVAQGSDGKFILKAVGGESGVFAATNGSLYVNAPANGAAFTMGNTTSFSNLTLRLTGLCAMPVSTVEIDNCTIADSLRGLIIVRNGGAYANGAATVRMRDTTWQVDGQNAISINVGARENANAYGRWEVSGASTVYLRNVKTSGGSAARTSGLNIAAANATGVVDISGTSSLSIVGASSFDTEGMVKVVSGANANATLSVRDDATLYAYNDIIVAASSDSTGLFCLSNNAVATARRRVYLGNDSSKDARLVVTGNAKLVSPLIEARASSSENFVTNRFEFAGGTVETARIAGADQMALALSGTPTLKASAASTAAAPILSGAKVEANSGAVVVIDTQSYATYLDQDFGPGVTVVKRGSGTLYVKNSNHAKTVVESGEVAFYDGATHFGDAWEVFDGATPPYAVEGATEAGDTFLASFSSQAAAEAFIDDYKAAYSPADGWNYDFAVSEDGSGLWSVTATASEAVPGNLAWSGAAGDSWDAPASWTPARTPTHNDGATVSGAATIAMPSIARAKTLAFNGDGGLSFSGTSKLAVADSLSIAGDTAGAKVISVAAGSSLAASAPAISVTTVALAKEGAGALSVELPVKNTVTALGAAAAADSANLSVREGSMTVKGAGAVISLSNFTPASTTQFSGTKKVGTTNLASAPSLAELVFDKCGADGAVTVGGGNADVSRLVVSNGAIVALGNVGIAAASGKTAELLLASGGKLAATPGNSVRLGAASASFGTTSVEISGAESSIYSTDGGNANGTIYFGAGLDAQVRDGGAIASDRSSSASNTRVLGWIAGNSYASGTVTFGEGGTISFGGGFCVNNYNVTASDSVKFTVAFDGGSFVPKQSATINTTEARNSRHAIFRSPEYQGFKVLAGGMNVDMANSPRYVIAAPVRGTGALVKTGSGTLVMGTGRTYSETIANHNYWYNDGTASIVESGVVTVQNAGGVVVREGAVEIESGATDANSAFTVEAGATLDLAGNTISLGAVSGAGTVDGNGGAIAGLTLKATPSGGNATTFEDVAISGRVVVDFGREAGDPDSDAPAVVAILGAGATGLDNGNLVHAANTGDESLVRAILSVAEGVVTATPAPSTQPTVISFR